MKNKVLAIGLDCGTFRFIKRYAGEGWPPNLKRVTRSKDKTAQNFWLNVEKMW